MKAITLWQPWASLIAMGLKTIETRTHNRFACLKGHTIAIHAGLKFDASARELVTVAMDIDGNFPSPMLTELYRSKAQPLTNPNAWPRGCVVCTVPVRDARALDEDDAEAALCFTGEDIYGLILGKPQAFTPPIPCQGRQGIWEWSAADRNCLQYPAAFPPSDSDTI